MVSCSSSGKVGVGEESDGQRELNVEKDLY